MAFNREQLLLYAVTDRSGTQNMPFLSQIEEALQNGVTLLQLREKNMEEQAFIDEAVQVLKLCRRYGVPLIINDNVQVALKSGAHGVHVGASDQPVREIRRLAGREFIIGATAKTVEQARSAQQSGADYLGVGAVFPSPTKKDAVRITAQQLREICGAVSIPAVAIGGITEENLGQLRGSGIAGIAVVSAIFASQSPGSAAARLAKMARELVGR